MENINYKLVNKLREVRLNRNVSAEDLAMNVGVLKGTIESIEMGIVTPSLILALKISRYLNTTVNDIFSVEYTPFIV